MKIERPFKVLGVQQVAIGAPNKKPLQEFWVELLGITKIGNYESAAENVNEDICQIGAGAFAVEIDLMQPLDPERSPKVHVPPLNHIGLITRPKSGAQSTPLHSRTTKAGEEAHKNPSSYMREIRGALDDLKLLSKMQILSPRTSPRRPGSGISSPRSAAHSPR